MEFLKNNHRKFAFVAVGSSVFSLLTVLTTGNYGLGSAIAVAGMVSIVLAVVGQAND